MKKVSLLPASLAAMLFAFASCGIFEGDEQTIELPPSIQNYLDSHYSDYEVEESEQDTLCTGVVVQEVELELSDDEELELVFDGEGNLLFTESEISPNELPAVVTSSISANFAGFTTAEADRLDLADGAVQYEVELKNGQTHLDVLFAADGSVICQEEDDDDGE